MAHTWIWGALVLQFLGYVFDAVWHGLLNPGFEPQTAGQMIRHLSTVHLPVYLGAASVPASTCTTLVLGGSVLCAGAEAWHAFSHLAQRGYTDLMSTRPALRPGDRAPEFTLPAVTGDGTISLSHYRGKSAVLLGLFRGLHCPFCRRQIFQLSGMHDTLAEMDVTTVAVVNTPRQRAELYFRYHPVRVVLLADPDARTHHAFGVPSVVLDESFAAVRINPTGELPGPMHPMEANSVLNAKDGFVLTQVDEEVFSVHGTQLGGHFLIDRDGIVRWSTIEAEHGVADLTRFPGPAEILTAARGVRP